jgi:hypothetical protein
MANRKSLLNNLLRTLVREWGYEAVEAALTGLSQTDASELAGTNDRGTRRRPPKLLASEQVARAHLSETQGETLRELAGRFDRKQFLPSMVDVREFLIMMGERPGAIKDRSEAFRRLLEALSKLPPDRLSRVANSARHSGPSQLGPLSDAISAVAASLPRHREPSSS